MSLGFFKSILLIKLKNTHTKTKGIHDWNSCLQTKNKQKGKYTMYHTVFKSFKIFCTNIEPHHYKRTIHKDHHDPHRVLTSKRVCVNSHILNVDFVQRPKCLFMNREFLQLIQSFQTIYYPKEAKQN